MSNTNTPTTPEEMWAMIVTLQREVTALRDKPQSERLKMKEPEPFHGERDKIRGFLTQMRAYQRFNIKPTTTEASKVLHAASYLRGQALAWFEPRMRDYLENPGEAKDGETRLMFEDYDEFEKRLKKVFGDTDEERKAERELARLRQTTSVAAYAATFRQVTSNLDWEDEPLIARFYEGLKDDVKDELIKLDRPEGLTEYIEMAVRIDERLYERRMERSKRTTTIPWSRSTKFQGRTGGRQQQRFTKKANYGDPMELDTTNRSNDKKGGCYQCGKEGHFKRDCPQAQGEQKWKKPWRKVPDVHRKQINLATKKDLDEQVEYQKDPEEPEEVQPGRYNDDSEELEHATLSWTACYDDGCLTHYSDKSGSGWWPRKTRKTRSLCMMQVAHDDTDSNCGCSNCQERNENPPINDLYGEEEYPQDNGNCEEDTAGRTQEEEELSLQVEQLKKEKEILERSINIITDAIRWHYAGKGERVPSELRKAISDAYNEPIRTNDSQNTQGTSREGLEDKSLCTTTRHDTGGNGSTTEEASEAEEQIPRAKGPRFTKNRVFRAPIEGPGKVYARCQYEGPGCDEQRFENREELDRHLQLHEGINRCPEQGCSYKTTFWGCLLRHLRSNHSEFVRRHGLEQKYDCKRCGKEFKDKAKRGRHQHQCRKTTKN